jgi:SAM-dependent methyltransferase
MFKRLVKALGLAKGDLYTPEFYAKQQAKSRASAHAVLPVLLNCIAPRSAIDVGCGVGTWAAELTSLGIEADGIDGEYVLQNALQISRERFRPVDLERLPSAGTVGSYDLALCLEVAEHLKAENGDAIVEFLTGLAPNVLFSAAIPGQGGVGHLNERWQSYWVSLFEARGFYCHDVIRSAVWSNPDVEPWYSQNAFLFTKDPRPDLVGSGMPIDMVHPRIFTMKRKRTRKEKREKFSYAGAKGMTAQAR